MEITDAQRKKLEEVAQKYQLELVLLFGSQVTGKTHRESDYDVAYLSSRDLDLKEESSLFVDLLPVIRPPDERLLNLVGMRKASPLLLYDMTSKSQVLYEKRPSTFARLRAYAFKRYVDLKPLYEAKFRRLGKLIQSYDI